MTNQLLLRSWLIVTTLWFLILFIVWGCSIPDIQAAVDSMSWVKEKPEAIHLLNDFRAIGIVISYWTIPVLGACSLGLFCGLTMSWITHKAVQLRQDSVNKMSDSWRSIHISKGYLPKPNWASVPAKHVNLSYQGDLNRQMRLLKPPYSILFNDILGYIAQHPDAFVGEGHTEDLLEHSLNVLRTAMNPQPLKEYDPLLPIAAIAHDIGKTISWTRNKNGAWTRAPGKKGNHDTQGGLLVAGMPSFSDISHDEQKVLLACLKYAHKKSKTPILEPSLAPRLRELQMALTSADQYATRSEKSARIESIEQDGSDEQIFIEAFYASLSSLTFQTPTTQRGARASGWRQGNKVYLLEHGMRDAVAQNLPLDIAAAYGKSKRTRGSFSGITLKLFQVLEENGILVKETSRAVLDEHGKVVSEKIVKCASNQLPLWTVRCGKLDFNGVFIVDIPKTQLYRLPDDAPFDVIVTGQMLAPERKRSLKNPHPPKAKENALVNEAVNPDSKAISPSEALTVSTPQTTSAISDINQPDNTTDIVNAPKRKVSQENTKAKRRPKTADPKGHQKQNTASKEIKPLDDAVTKLSSDDRAAFEKEMKKYSRQGIAVDSKKILDFIASQKSGQRPIKSDDQNTSKSAYFDQLNESERKRFRELSNERVQQQLPIVREDIAREILMAREESIAPQTPTKQITEEQKLSSLIGRSKRLSNKLASDAQEQMKLFGEDTD